VTLDARSPATRAAELGALMLEYGVDLSGNAWEAASFAVGAGFAAAVLAANDDREGSA
jgi:hypothetical protein